MQKQCLQCSSGFEVTDSDLAFLQRVSPVISGKRFDVPAPTLCPDCRQQRRHTWRNERRLYHRKCDLTGEQMISMYSPDKPFTVYSSDAWNSDQWNALSYGRDFDFNRPFFDQFQDLQRAVPRMALNALHNENCPYVNHSGYNKNSHLIFAAEYDEDCLYGTQIIKSKNCVDTLDCFESEACYELVDCEKSYELFFSRDCSNCSSSYFLSDSKGCSDCLFCVSLRGKKFCIFNKQVSEEEYKQQKVLFLARLQKGELKQLTEEFESFTRSLPHRDRFIINCENVTGDYLQNSQNLHHCFDVSYGQDCSYVYTGFQIKDLMDICHTTEAELGYEGMSFGYGAYGCLFTHGSWSSNLCLYSDIVHSCTSCFGCVGLLHKQYCILNKQYTKEEYEAIVPKIIEHMQKTGEWGEYFPIRLSPFAYNETLAQQYYPLPKEEIEKRGWGWREEEEPAKAEKTISAFDLPGSIEAVSDDILNWAILCDATGKLFRLVKKELEFYRQHALPVPHFHPDERHRRRLALRNPRKLWDRNCAKCRRPLKTGYSPDRPDSVYCESCYLETVY